MIDQEQRVARIAIRAGERHARRLTARAGDMPLRQAYELYQGLLRKLDRFEDAHLAIGITARSGFCPRHSFMHSQNGTCLLD